MLFVCVRNAGKSPMAAGLLRDLTERHTPGRLLVESAGTRAEGDLNALSVSVLAEQGVDIGGERPRQLTDQILRRADVVVMLGTAAEVNRITGPRYETWEVDEPSRRGFEGLQRMRMVRDDIESRVVDLHRRLTAG